MFYSNKEYECLFCKEMGYSITMYNGSMMTNHAQTGDPCCLHCSISISFDFCKFCDNFKFFKFSYKRKRTFNKADGRCTLHKKFKEGHETCSDWKGDTSFLQQ